MSSRRTVAVTGATGFVGRRAVRTAVQRGDEVAAWCSRLDAQRIRDLRELGATMIENFDITDARALAAALDRNAPTHVLHLAAVADPRVAEREPERARRVNVEATGQLVDALAPGTHFLLASSAAVYAPSEEALTEDAELGPRSVYGATKRDAEERVRAAEHLVTVVARAFNHSGPGQSSAYALPAFAERLHAFAAKGGDSLRTGPLDALRDFLHVDDVVDAYLHLLETAPTGTTVNVCSGRALSMRAAFEGLARRILGEERATEVLQRVVEDEALASPNKNSNPSSFAPDRIVGDPSKLAILGFEPCVPLEELLDGIAAPAPPR